MEKEKVKKYYCSKHGNIGDINCKECVENLRKLCLEKNAYLTGDIHTGKGAGSIPAKAKAFRSKG